MPVWSGLTRLRGRIILGPEKGRWTRLDIFSPIHLIVLLVVALLVFGPKRLPEIGAGLGKTIRNFKAAMNDDAALGAGVGGKDIIDGDVRPKEGPAHRSEE